MIFKIHPQIISNIIIWLTCITIISCNVVDPKEDIPSYIKIESIKFESTLNNADITDAWLYIDDQNIGAFELPANIPVYYSGKHKITVRSGIKLNGISATRAYYPFYTYYETTENLIEGQTLEIYPKTSYRPEVEFKWTEHFENPNLSLKKRFPSDTSIMLLPNAGKDTFEFGGNSIGAIYLTAQRPYFQCQTDTFYSLPYGDQPSFLEINYKTNNHFTVSVLIYTTGGTSLQEYLTINPSQEWKKVYVNLTPITNLFTSQAKGYRIIFNHYLDESNASQGGKILIDNIRLINFNLN